MADDFDKLIKLAEQSYKRLAHNSPKRSKSPTRKTKPDKPHKEAVIPGYRMLKIEEKSEKENKRHLRVLKKQIIDSHKLCDMIISYLPIQQKRGFGQLNMEMFCRIKDRFHWDKRAGRSIVEDP